MGLQSHVVLHEIWTDATSFVMNETGAKGLVVVHDLAGQSGSGGILDDADSIVKYPDVAYTSGEFPAGVLLTEVVNYDLTRTHLNANKRQAQIGSKVAVMKIGSIVTDAIAAGVTVRPGARAYGTTNGQFTTVSNALLQLTGAMQDIRPVGTFRSTQDSDGYCRIDINVI